MKRKVLSALLAFAMLLSMVVMPVGATETELVNITPISIGLYTDNTTTGENRVAKSLLYADYSSGASADMMVDGVFGVGTQGTVMGVDNNHTYFLMDLGEERAIHDIYVYGVPGFSIYFTGYFEFRGTNDPDATFAEMDVIGSCRTDAIPNDSSATTADIKLSNYKTATGTSSYRYIAVGRPNNAGGVCTQWALTEIEVYAEGTGSDQPITPPGPSEPTIPETLVSRNKPLEVFRNDTLVDPESSLNLIFNGLKSDIGYVTAGSENTGSYYVRVDLMNKMPVTDVGLIVRPSSWGGILEASNKIQIRGTNDSSARFEDMTLLTETNFTSQPDNNIDFSWSLSRNEGYNEDLEFRYICIGRPNLDYGGTIILVEAEIYGRPEVDFSGWKKSADGDANTVSVDIKNNTDDTQSYLLVAMGYDEDDKPSDVEVTSVDVTPGRTETASAVVASASTKKQPFAMLVKSLDDAAMVIDSYPMKNVAANLESSDNTINLTDSVSYIEKRDGFELKTDVQSSFGYQPDGRMGILAVGPDVTFDTAQPTDIVFAGGIPVAVGEAQTLEYVMAADAEGGDYAVKLTYSDEDETEAVGFDYFKIAMSEYLTMYQDFEGVTQDGFFDLVKLYANTKGYMSVTEMDEDLTVDSLENIGESYIIAKNAYRSGELREGFTSSYSSVDEIYDVIKAALAIDALQNKNGDELTEVVKKYSDCIPKLIPENAIDNFASFYTAASVTELSELVNNISRSLGLASMKNGTTEDVLNALQTYEDALCVDLDAIEEEKVPLVEIAKRIDTSIPASYLDGLEDEIETIIDKYKDSLKDSSSSSKGSGGGGGGGFGIKVSADMLPKPDTGAVNTPVSTSKSVFGDMAGFEWANDAVERLYEREIVNGVGGGKFEPNRPVTRAEFVKMMVIAFDISTETDVEVEFSDVFFNDWYYPYVLSAYLNEIVQGNGETFNPNDDITRQDAAVICTRLVSKYGIETEYRKIDEFSDMGEVSDYAKPQVKFAAERGLVNGMGDGTFRPVERLTRAQAAVLVSRIINLMEGAAVHE